MGFWLTGFDLFRPDTIAICLKSRRSIGRALLISVFRLPLHLRLRQIHQALDQDTVQVVELCCDTDLEVIATNCNP